MSAEHGLHTVAWSPLGGITFHRGEKSNVPKSTLDDPVVKEVAASHQRSVAQTLLRRNLQPRAGGAGR